MSRLTFSLLLLGFIFCASLSYAQKIQVQEGKQSKFTITKNDYSSLQLNVSIAEINHFTTKTKEGNFAQLVIPGYGSSNIVGNPKIPVLKKIIEVPIGADFSIQIINENYKEFNLADYKVQDKIFPAQPPLSKSIDNPDDIEFKFNKSTYLSNTYLSPEMVKIVPLGQMRGVQLARLEIALVQYNPVLNKIKVCTDLTVEVTFTGADINKTINLKKELFSPYFEGLYQSVSNFKNEITDGLITDNPVTYVIVSDPMFQSTLQPFVEWKTKKGFFVIEGYTNNPNVGTTTATIKDYLQDLYNNPGLGINPQSFVLFVGDVAQIPAFSGTAGSHVSDLYYCDYTGDIYPECFYGRFSASDISELQPQIDKTLEYEQYLMPDPSFLDEVVMVTGDDSSHELTWGNGQINYGTTYYFNATHGLISHTYLQDEPTGANYSENIRQNVSDGVAYGNYSAHCSSNGWADPSFVISNIAALTNAHKYPLLVGNCCLSNQFDVDDCFGEEILQAVDKGALGYIGGSNNTYWDEDFWWGVGYETVSANPVYNAANLGSYDRTFHDNGEATSDWFITQGQMPSAGNLAVTQAASSLETYYWEIYHLMGDPSLMVYMSQPEVTNASYDLMPPGAATFTINTEPYAYVGITKDGVLHGAGIANGVGFVEITMNPTITLPGNADIIITRQNGRPFIGTVTVVSPSGPYLSLASFVIDDIAGNNNGEADYNEDISLDITLENIGSAVASNVSATLSSTDSHVSITDNTQSWNDIPAGTTSLQTGAFAVTISNDVPDQHLVEFELEITDGSEIWNTTFQITIQAPVLEFGSMMVDDVIGGNGNGMLDPGETANIIIETSNIGHSLSPFATANLNSTSSWITLTTTSYNLGQIGIGSTANAAFSLTVSPSAPIGTSVDLDFDLVAGNYGTAKSFVASIGLMIEDWETGDFTKYPWVLGGDAIWTIDDVEPFEGVYCAKSGLITDSQVSEMEITVDVTNDGSMSFYRKVSSESGYDYLKFYIDDVLADEWAGTLAWGQVSFPVSAGVHTFKWQYYKDGSVSSGSDCVWVDYIIFPHPVPPVSPPYQTAFEEAGSLPEGWSNAAGDDFNWTIISGATGSTGTGPSGDHTTGSGYYIYTESSSPNYPSMQADLITPNFDLSSFADVELRFWYHMYGAEMGELHLDIYHNDSWFNDIMTTISGDQGDLWYEQVVDLSSYSGETIKLRFRGITGSSYTSDMAIDDFSIDGTIIEPGINFNLTAFLDGPFVSTEMATSLNSSGYLPVSQPYNTYPWDYAGTESVVTIPNSDVVDWVLVELRETAGSASSATPATTIAQKAGFILKDGSIVDLDGNSLIRFDITISDNIYAIVYHRNHLGIMSAYPLVIIGDSYTYNFTTNLGQVYGDLNGHIEVVPGVWGMASGNADGDGEVDNKDKNEIWKIEMGNNGYLNGDFDMNGSVDMNDKNGKWKFNSGNCSFIVK